jgi:hypothetical protein
MVELVKGKSIDSFSDEVARTVSTMIADHSSSYRFIELIRNPDGRQVSIDIKGKFFNVEYSGELPQSSYLPYHRSNEKFDKYIFKVINAMHDIDGFKGIAGGFTFPLSLVLNMQCKNNLETLTFVDNDKSQLFHGIFVTLRYDKIFSESSKQFSQIKIRDNATPLLFLQKSKTLSCKKMTITFKNNEMEKELENTDEKHKYFIYLSNAFEFGVESDYSIPSIGGWEKSKKTHELLTTILRNGNIAIGSCIMPVEANSSDFMILRKGKDGFTVPYFHFRDSSHSLKKNKRVRTLFEKEFGERN